MREPSPVGGSITRTVVFSRRLATRSIETVCSHTSSRQDTGGEGGRVREWLDDQGGVLPENTVAAVAGGSDGTEYNPGFGITTRF